MEYRKFDNTIVLRLDVGDEIITSLIELIKKENIKLGHFYGLGASNDITVGIFDVTDKQYYSTTYKNDYEISNLTGNITIKDNEPYLHAHITICNPKTDECHGGHLNKAVISATSEIFITMLNGEVNRQFDDLVGLNLFKF